MVQRGSEGGISDLRQRHLAAPVPHSPRQLPLSSGLRSSPRGHCFARSHAPNARARECNARDSHNDRRSRRRGADGARAADGDAPPPLGARPRDSLGSRKVATCAAPSAREGGAAAASSVEKQMRHVAPAERSSGVAITSGGRGSPGGSAPGASPAAAVKSDSRWSISRSYSPRMSRRRRPLPAMPFPYTVVRRH